MMARNWNRDHFGDGSYNGFSQMERQLAFVDFKLRIRAGLKPARPSRCDLCRQEAGCLEWHSEDYSEPWGQNIGAFGLCYTCHMMIHCRFSRAWAFNRYRAAVLEGAVFEPNLDRGFHLFGKLFLARDYMADPIRYLAAPTSDPFAAMFAVGAKAMEGRGVVQDGYRRGRILRRPCCRHCDPSAAIQSALF